MKSYTFKVVLEQDKWPDEPDSAAVWRAYVPGLQAAHAWGDTQQQALDNLRNAVEMVLEDLLEEGVAIPQQLQPVLRISEEPLVTVTI